jgi:antitoxin component YwqK of YwqJK toxin-antitoxin module
LKFVYILKINAMKYFLSLVCLIAGLVLNAQTKELKTYFDNGKLKSTYNYQDAANYTVQNFFENGNLMETGRFVNAKMDGIWVNYSENGQRAGEAFYSNGVKTGDWKVYDLTGMLKYKITYQNDRIVNAISLDANGQNLAETTPR